MAEEDLDLTKTCPLCAGPNVSANKKGQIFCRDCGNISPAGKVITLRVIHKIKSIFNVKRIKKISKPKKKKQKKTRGRKRAIIKKKIKKILRVKKKARAKRKIPKKIHKKRKKK